MRSSTWALVIIVAFVALLVFFGVVSCAPVAPNYHPVRHSAISEKVVWRADGWEAK